MTKSIVCGGCRAAVPYGRLSCPSCGEMLASVAGAARRYRAAEDGSRSTGSTVPVPAAPVEAAAATLATPVTAAAMTAPTPGAYLPPSPVPMPAGPPAPARAWAGHGAEPGDPAAPHEAVEATSSSGAGLGMDVPRLMESIGWLAIAGAALAIAGFILPWASSVIGASGVGYLDRWGLAGPGHPIVALGLLGIVALALLRDRVPLWLGVGLPGLGLGALLFGLVWPYLVGPLGGQIGVTAVALGAVALAAAGTAALVADRHAGDDRAV
jgi:hypothetical protein